MSSTMDDLAPLSARRKGDRQAMALQVVDLAGEYKLAALWIPEVKGSRRTYVDIEGPRGLKLSVRFDGNGSDPDTYVLSWHGVEGARLVPGKFYSVNSFHGHKATDVAYGWAQLTTLLRRRFAAIRDDSAFEDVRPVYVVTFAAERDRHDLSGLRRMLKSEAVGLLASAQRSGAVVNADTGETVVTS